MKLRMLCSILVIGFLAKGDAPVVLFPRGPFLVTGGQAVIVARAGDIQTPRTEQVIKTVRTGPVVHLLVRLKPGKNEFPVILVKGRAVVRKRVLFHSFPSRHYLGLPDARGFHQTPDAMAPCQPCHNTNHSSHQTNVSQKSSLGTCLGCHTDKTGDVKHQHEGFDPESCSDCHSETDQTVETPCLDCHDEVEARQHAPYAQRECTVCHDPHGSEQKALLRADVRTVCTWCHRSDLYREREHPVYRHPLESKNVQCTSCHNPHGSPFPALTRWAPEVICGTCHHQ